MTHCTLSRRDDRNRTPSGIIEATSVSHCELGALAGARLIIPLREARRLLSKLDLWVKHDWYLTFLAHTEASTLQRDLGKPLAVSKSEQDDLIGSWGSERLVDALQARVTTRDFRTGGVTKARLEDLTQTIEQHLPRWITCYFAALSVDGVDSALYCVENSGLRRVGDTNRRVVRELMIGQPWAGKGDVVAWLVADLNMAIADDVGYEQAQGVLGMFGQRACLWATDAGVGVFVSPAVADAATFDYLGLPNSDRWAGYVLQLGAKGSNVEQARRLAL